MRQLFVFIMGLVLITNVAMAQVATYSLTPKSNAMSMNISPLDEKNQAAIMYVSGNGTLAYKDNWEGDLTNRTLGGVIEAPMPNDIEFYFDFFDRNQNLQLSRSYTTYSNSTPVNVEVDAETDMSTKQLQLAFSIIPKDKSRLLRIILGNYRVSQTIRASASATNSSNGTTASGSEYAKTDYSLNQIAVYGNLEIHEGFRIGGVVLPPASVDIEWDGDLENREGKDGNGLELALGLGYMQENYSIAFDYYNGLEDTVSLSRAFSGYGVMGEYVIKGISISAMITQVRYTSLEHSQTNLSGYSHQDIRFYLNLPVQAATIGVAMQQATVSDYDNTSSLESRVIRNLGLNIMTAF